LKKTFIPTVIICFLLVFTIAPGALALVEQSEAFFVTDAAGVLSAATKNDIIDANIDLMDKCQGAQIVIVTIKYLDGMGADEYAMRLFRDWGVGDAELDNGMLLLLVTEERRGGLVPGKGIIGSWDDATINKTLDAHFWPEVDNGNFDAAVRNICEELFSWYAGYYGIDTGGSDYAQPPVSGGGGNDQPGSGGGGYARPPVSGGGNSQQPQGSGLFPILGFLVMLVPFLFIFFFIVIIIAVAASADRRRYRTYYTHMGMPIPRYHWWFALGHRPHRVWYHRHHHHHRHGPRGPGGFGGSPRGPGGFGGSPRGPGGGGASGFGGRSGGSSGGFGGSGGSRSGGGSRGGGGFGGFGGSGGGRGGGGFGGFGGSGGSRGGGFGGGGGRSGGGFSGGGGRGGGFGGRR